MSLEYRDISSPKTYYSLVISIILVTGKGKEDMKIVVFTFVVLMAYDCQATWKDNPEIKVTTQLT